MLVDAYAVLAFNVAMIISDARRRIDVLSSVVWRIVIPMRSVFGDNAAADANDVLSCLYLFERMILIVLTIVC